MMLEWLSLVEAPPDPIWLRTLATVLPVIGTMVVGIVAAPWVVEKVRAHNRTNRDQSPERSTHALPVDTGGPGLPAPVTLAANERASADPILRLFIDDLHQRLSMAHEEAAQLHTQRAGDAATIARLGAEIADKEERLRDCEQELEEKTTQNRALRRRLEELKHDLEATRRRLAICLEDKGFTE